MARPIEWTLEKLKEKASEYDSYTKFRLNEQSAYRSAKRQRVIGLICGHMENVPVGRPRKWTEQTIMAAAGEYSSLEDFIKGNRSAYVVAHRNGLLEQIRAFYEGEPGGAG